jgi:RNA polymerase sigma-70 factor (ECF subfamily)
MTPSAPSGSLERYAASGDADAFQDLVRQYQDMVYHTCLRVLERPSHDVDDAVQETFLKLARSARSIHGNVAAWLHACARTTALDRRRAQRVRAQREREAQAELAQETAHPGDSHEREEQHRIIEECVDELPERDREVVVSYFYLGRTQQQIADGLGVSQVAVQKRLANALEVLKKRCLKRGVAVAVLLAGLSFEASAAAPAELGARLAQLDGSGTGGMTPGAAQGATRAAARRATRTAARGAGKPATAALIALGAAVLAVLAWIGIAATARPGATTAPTPADPTQDALATSALPSGPNPAPAPAVVTPTTPPPYAFAPALDDPSRWTLLGVRSSPTPGEHPVLRLDSTGIAGEAVLQVPALPPSYVVEFEYRTAQQRCPFTSLVPAPELGVHTPGDLAAELKDFNAWVNAFVSRMMASQSELARWSQAWAPGSWHALRFEVRGEGDARTTRLLIDGKETRLAKLPGAGGGESLAFVVSDGALDLRALRIAELGETSAKR